MYPCWHSCVPCRSLQDGPRASASYRVFRPPSYNFCTLHNITAVHGQHLRAFLRYLLAQVQMNKRLFEEPRWLLADRANWPALGGNLEARGGVLEARRRRSGHRPKKSKLVSSFYPGRVARRHAHRMDETVSLLERTVQRAPVPTLHSVGMSAIAHEDYLYGTERGFQHKDNYLVLCWRKAKKISTQRTHESTVCTIFIHSTNVMDLFRVI